MGFTQNNSNPIVKVFIVEDDAITATAIQRALTNIGYECLGTAYSSDAAINALENLKPNKPDIILMDVNLSEKTDGFSLASFINKSSRHIPIIFLTAYSYDMHINDCAKPYVYGYLTKPIRLSELHATIDIALSKHAAITAEESLNKKEAILKAIGNASAVLLSGRDYKTIFNDYISELCKLTGFSEAILYRNIVTTSGNKSDVINCYPEVPNSVYEYYKKISKIFIDDAEFSELIHGHGIFAGSFSSVIPKEANVKNPGSGIILPVFSKGSLWGVLVMHTPIENAEWSDDEIDGLKTAVLLLENAIKNNDLYKNIKKSESKYLRFHSATNTLCNNIPQALWVIDESKRYIFVNEKFAKQVLHLTSADDAIGHSKEEFIAIIEKENQKFGKNKDNELIYHLGNDLNDGEEPVTYNCQINEGESNKYYNIFKSPAYDENGLFIGSLGSIHDSTREKTYEANILEANNRFNSFMDNLPAIAYIREPDGQIIYANKSANKEINIHEPDGSYKSIVQVLDEQKLIYNSDEDLTKFKDTIKSGHAASIAGTVIKNDHKKHLVHYTIFEMDDGKKKSIGVIGFDKTQEKEVEDKYQTLFSNSTDGIITIRGKSIVDCNNEFCRIIGRSKEEILNLSDPIDIFPVYQADGKRTFDEMDDIYQRVINGQIFRNHALRFENAKGEIVDTTVNINLIKQLSTTDLPFIYAIIHDQREEIRSKNALIESERKYREIFDNSPVGIEVYQDNKIVYMSPSVSMVMGLSEDEIRNNITNHIHPNDMNISAILRGLRSYPMPSLIFNNTGKDAEVYTIHISDSNNEQRIIQVRISIIEWDGKPAYLNFLINITETEKARHILENSKNLYQNLFEKMPVGVEIRQEGKTVYRSNLLKKMISDIPHSDDPNYLENILSMTIESNNNDKYKSHYAVSKEVKPYLRVGYIKSDPNVMGNSTYTVSARETTGKIKTFSVITNKVDWAGKTANLISVIDITERQDIYHALEESEMRYRSVVENAQCLIAIVQNGILGYVNPLFEEFTGQERDELKGKVFADFVDPESHDYVIETMKNMTADEIEGDNVLDSERMSSDVEADEPKEKAMIVTLVNNKGKKLYVTINMSVIEWDGKRAHLCFMNDITAQIVTADKLRNALAEKTILLQEVHHRVKNNLALISSLLNLQSHKVKNEEILMNLREAETRIFSIAAVHEGLYRSESIARIPAQSHFMAIAHEIVSSYSNKTKIELDFDAGDYHLELNEAIPVSLVLNEIVTNAVKYAFPNRSKGKITLRMNYDDSITTIVIEDDGVGIQKDFDLETCDSLGIMLIQNIVTRQMDGLVLLDRSVEVGTRWIIKIPRNI